MQRPCGKAGGGRDTGEVDASGRLLIADKVLRRQLNPMERARLIQRLKEMHGIKQGKKDSSVKMTEEAKALGIGPETAKRLVRLNALIPPLQALVSEGHSKPPLFRLRPLVSPQAGLSRPHRKY